MDRDAFYNLSTILSSFIESGVLFLYFGHTLRKYLLGNRKTWVLLLFSTVLLALSLRYFASAFILLSFLDLSAENQALGEQVTQVIYLFILAFYVIIIVNRIEHFAEFIHHWRWFLYGWRAVLVAMLVQAVEVALNTSSTLSEIGMSYSIFFLIVISGNLHVDYLLLRGIRRTFLARKNPNQVARAQFYLQKLLLCWIGCIVADVVSIIFFLIIRVFNHNPSFPAWLFIPLNITCHLGEAIHCILQIVFQSILSSLFSDHLIIDSCIESTINKSNHSPSAS